MCIILLRRDAFWSETILYINITGEYSALPIAKRDRVVQFGHRFTIAINFHKCFTTSIAT